MTNVVCVAGNSYYHGTLRNDGGTLILDRMGIWRGMVWREHGRGTVGV